MKTIIVPLLLTATAVLAEPRAITRPLNETDTAWNWLASIAQGEMDENHLQSHGMPHADTPKLKAFAKDAQAADDAWWHAENAKLCKDRKRYEHDPERLAQWYERMQVEQAKEQQKILDKLPEAIGPADALSFKSAVAAHTAESVGEVGHLDNAGMLRDGTVTAQAQLDNQCAVPQTVTELRAE